MALAFPVVHFKTDCVPELGGNLPFVKQAWIVSYEQVPGTDVGHGYMLGDFVWVIHIDDALGQLFGCGGFSAPLWAFYDNSAVSFEFLVEQGICDSMLISFHIKYFLRQR